MVTRGQRIGEPFLPTDRMLYLACLRLVLTQVCIQAVLSGRLSVQVLRVGEGLLLAFNDVEDGFEEP